MAEPVKVPYQETAEEYAARIRDLIERDRVGGARELVQEAVARFPHHPALIRWQKALSLPRRYVSVVVWTGIEPLSSAGSMLTVVNTEVSGSRYSEIGFLAIPQTTAS